MMNMMQVMQKAQKMQKQYKEAQEELEKTKITGEAGNGAIEVAFTGQGKFMSISIKKEAINPQDPNSVDTDTVEMLEDLITTAMKDATTKANSSMEEKMKAITGGINIPGLF